MPIAAALAAVLCAAVAAPRAAPPPAGEPLPFKPGERLVYDITWMGIPGGEGRLNVLEQSVFNGRKVYLLEIIAKSTGWVRSLYPVDDRTVSYFDVDGKFSRKVEIFISENRYRKRKVIEFRQEEGKALYTVDNDKTEEYELDGSSQDSFSALYALRTMRPELKVGSILSIPIFEDRTRYMLEVNVLRKERIELPQGLVDTVVIEPKLKTEGIFSRRGSLTVWLTDDKNMIPVMMSSKVMIGAFVASLVRHSGVDIGFIPRQ